MTIILKTEEELAHMRKSGEILGQILEAVCTKAVPGISTGALDRIAEEMIRDLGGIPAFKGYHGFPAALCTGRNEVVVHGIPRDDEYLMEGDLLTIDSGVIYKGMYTDSARTIGIGEITPQLTQMITDAHRILDEAITAAQPGRYIGDISRIIGKGIRADGYSVVKELTGHGIGRSLHEDPLILNYDNGTQGEMLAPGMTMAIEPIFALGKGKIRTLADGWTIVTADYSTAIQVEHTIAITEHGPEILTR